MREVTLTLADPEIEAILRSRPSTSYLQVLKEAVKALPKIPKVGDRVEWDDGEIGDVLAVFGTKCWLNWSPADEIDESEWEIEGFGHPYHTIVDLDALTVLEDG